MSLRFVVPAQTVACKANVIAPDSKANVNCVSIWVGLTMNNLGLADYQFLPYYFIPEE